VRGSSDYFWARSQARGGTHAALRTARRRGKPRLRVLVASGAGPWPAPDSALRSRFPVCRVRRAARMARCRSMCPAARRSDGISTPYAAGRFW